MARSDLLVNLVRAGTSGDQELFRRTVDALIAEERAKNHRVLADRLRRSLETPQKNGKPTRVPSVGMETEIGALLAELTPAHELGDLILPPVVRSACEALVEEHRRIELLRAHNLEPRHRLLFAGPSGNGKTSLAHAVAQALVLPLYQVRYEGVVGSYLGETAQRLRRIFDFCRTRRCVLFFDEFDTLGKERGDEHETGEIKRVVSSLLLQVDALPSHVVVIAATNHAELLDRAAWRRFQLRCELPPPSRAQIELWLRMFEERHGWRLGLSTRTLADGLLGASFAEVEEFALDALRGYVLALPNADARSICRDQLQQYRARAGVGPTGHSRA